MLNKFIGYTLKTVSDGFSINDENEQNKFKKMKYVIDHTKVKICS